MCKGEPFTGADFSGTPFTPDVALQFPGAWDMGLLRHLVERHDLYDLTARQDLLRDDRSGARFGVQSHPDRAAAWLPHPFAVTLDMDLTGWDVECWTLGPRDRDRAVLTVTDGVTRIEQPEFLADAVYIFSR